MGKPKRQKFIKTIKHLNHTDLLYNNNNIIIIRVKSFNDCNKLFGCWTNWCIARSEEQWNRYCGLESREQYFIVDFNNLFSSDYMEENMSAIGFTLNKEIGFTLSKKINKEFPVYAAHAKNDKNLLDDYYKMTTGLHPFERILKNKGIYEFIVVNKMNADYLVSAKEKNILKWWLIISSLVFIVFYTFLFFNL